MVLSVGGGFPEFRFWFRSVLRRWWSGFEALVWVLMLVWVL